jgi:hypothetical protein
LAKSTFFDLKLKSFKTTSTATPLSTNDVTFADLKSICHWKLLVSIAFASYSSINLSFKWIED